MDIEHALQKQKVAQHKIENLINDFMRDTGLYIGDVEIRRVDIQRHEPACKVNLNPLLHDPYK